jgi:hypothetical protein
VLEQSADAYQSSKNDPDRGVGIKPLLNIKIKNRTERLHVHLVPDYLVRQMTGWNIKNAGVGYYYAGDLKTSMIVDQEDRDLFDKYAPSWKNQSSYPHDVIWNGRTAQEEAIIRDEELKKKREGYAKFLERKLETFVKKTANEATITETYTFDGTRPRKKKGETASQYKTFIEKGQRLEPVENVTITTHLRSSVQGAYEDQYRVKCVYAPNTYVAKKTEVSDKINAYAALINVVPASLVVDVSDWDNNVARVRQNRLAFIKDIRDGNRDAELVKYVKD